MSSGKIIDQINKEWMEYVVAHPHVFRWVGSKQGKLVAPLRQLEWKEKKGKSKRKLEANLAHEPENGRWVVYILDMSNKGKQISAKEVVVCNQGIWKVFAFWMKAKETTPADVAKDFVSKYQGLTTLDVEWIVQQFGRLSAEEIDSTERRLSGYSKYKQPKAFPLVQNPLTPTVVKDRKSTHKRTKTNGDVQMPEQPASSKAATPSRVLSASSEPAKAVEGKAVDGKHVVKELSGSTGPAASMDKNNSSKNKNAASLEDTMTKASSTTIVPETNKVVSGNDVAASQKIASTDKPEEVPAPIVRKSLKHPAPDASPLSKAVEFKSKPAFKPLASTSENNISAESEDDDSEVDCYGCSTREDDDEDEYEDDENVDYGYEQENTTAKWKSTPDFPLPAGAKQTCVDEENWPENFNIATDSVKAYAIVDENGTLKHKYFVHKPNSNWVEYYPASEPESAPEPELKRKRLRGTGQKFHPNTSWAEIRRATRITGYINARWG
ncbi:hypothetical protein DL98DRAFT_526234 [Cadophora sp. DSE1049]|nr:hypothetical protein DL98DRAFT_526234 [Cadophora sp. DSE1049]